MVLVTLQLEDTHARALSLLLKRMDLKSIERYSTSDQETYDMVFALQTLQRVLEEAA
jgi:hypothetical protein